MYIDFEYADKRLSDLGYVMCHINTESGFRDVVIGCDITFNTVKNNHSSVQYITSSSYDSVYSLSFDIMKNPCGQDYEDTYLTVEEVRHLITWLNRREYRKLTFISTVETDENINYYGSFNVKQIMNGNDIVGLSLTFTSNAPYGFADPECVMFDITHNNEHVYLYGHGDELGVVYPLIIIQPKQDCETFVLMNITTGTTLALRNCLKDEVITIDGEHKVILTDENKRHSMICNDFNYEYIDILVQDDDISENIYEVSQPCTITFKYSPIRKVGMY